MFASFNKLSDKMSNVEDIRATYNLGLKLSMWDTMEVLTQVNS